MLGVMRVEKIDFKCNIQCIECLIEASIRFLGKNKLLKLALNCIIYKQISKHFPGAAPRTPAAARYLPSQKLWPRSIPASWQRIPPAPCSYHETVQ